MAYSATQLDATTRTAFSNDKPVLLGENVLESVGASERGWRSWDSGSFVGDTTYGAYAIYSSNYDATDSTYPASRASDRRTNSRSRSLKPAALPNVYNDRWSLIFRNTSGMAFDSIGLLSHNFGTLSKAYGTANGGNPFVIKIGVSDDGSTWTTVATFTDPQTDKPIVGFNLANGAGSPSTYAQFSGVAYVAVSIVCASATMGQTPATLPEIGEVVFGRRLQLLHQASVPYYEQLTGSDSEKVTSGTGAYSTYTRSAGRRAIRGTYTITTEEADILNFYKNYISHGMAPFLFVPRGSKATFPSSYGGDEPGESFWVSLQDYNFTIAVGVGLYSKSIDLDMLELAPYNSGIT